ncbi:MAG: hypothetical protein JO283_20835 [Bradyrhizobium sp.]|nr:hypothetical protein [Bradyrhizobium sp.]
MVAHEIGQCARKIFHFRKKALPASRVRFNLFLTLACKEQVSRPFAPLQVTKAGAAGPGRSMLMMRLPALVDRNNGYERSFALAHGKRVRHWRSMPPLLIFSAMA